MVNARPLLVGALAAGTMLLAGCGGSAGAAQGSGGPQIAVSGTDGMRYSPDTISVKAGDAVTIAFKNAGIIPHDFITTGADKNVSLVNVGGGQQRSATFEASKPGTYQVICNQPGHKEAGMVAKIVVS